ncbi:MAG: conjugal transfer protein TraD [Parashewanella sp.]
MNTNLNDRLRTLNIPGTVLELTQAEAEELGAFEETALTEMDAIEATAMEVVSDEEK